MPSILRFLRLILFIFLDYYRSARIVIELIATSIFFLIFLRSGTRAIDAEYFFTVSSIFIFGLTLYTMSVMLNLSDRPHGYVLLARRLSRASYLLGFYSTGLVILISAYILMSLATILLHQPVGLTVGNWLLGTLPLFLNVSLLGALMLILSPMVVSSGWRLLILGLIALAFSSNFIGHPILDTLPTTVTNVLAGVQTILSWPLVPAFSGFALTLSRDYSGSALVILIAQVSLLVTLLAVAVYAFAQRDLIFTQ